MEPYRVYHSQKEAAPKATTEPSVEGLSPLLESGGRYEWAERTYLGLYFFFSILKVKEGKQKAFSLPACGELDNLAVVSRASPFSSLEVSWK